MLPLNLLNSTRCSQKLLFPISTKFWSTISTSQNESFSTFSHILSDESKQRVQQNRMSLQPVQTTKEAALGDFQNVAAVLLPMCLVNNEPSLLLTLRSAKLSSHSGHVSFPGGHVDENDTDLAFTALRETQEELGIDPSAFDIWGQMNPMPARNGKTIVYPILGSTGEIDISSLRLSENEVDEVFSVTIEHLCRCDTVRSTRFRHDTYKPGFTTPVYLGAAHRIWGLTALLIDQLLAVIATDAYKFKLRHKRHYTAR